MELKDRQQEEREGRLQWLACLALMAAQVLAGTRWTLASLNVLTLKVQCRGLTGLVRESAKHC